MPSSHCGICTLIWFTGIWDPWFHWCVARNKVIAILLLTYPQILDYGFCHFVVGVCLSFSGYPQTPHPVTHQWSQREAKSAGIAGGMPPGTSFSSIFMHIEDTSLVYSSSRILRQCSRHTCHEHCQSPYAIYHGSEVHPSIPWPLASVLMGRNWTHTFEPLSFAPHNLHI